MGDVRTSVIVDLAGNLPRQATRYGQQFTKFSKISQRASAVMKRSLVGLDRQLGRVSNRYTALLTGVVATSAVKQVVSFDASITRLGTNALLSEKKVEGIKQQILDVANLPEIRLGDDQLAASVQKLFELTGDVSFVEDNIKTLGLAMQGYGADAEATAELVAQFWEKGIRAPADIEGSLDRLFGQFAKAKIPVGDIARIAPQLFSVITSKGPEAVNQMAALLQVYSKTAGNAERSLTALRGTFAVFDDPKKVSAIDSALQAAGFDKIHTADGELRAVHQLLLDIVEVGGNSTQTLSSMFEREALFGLKALLDPKNKALLLELVDSEVQRGMTHLAAAKNAATAQASLVSLGNAGRKYANDNLSQPIQELADAVNELKPEQVEAFFDKIKTGAIVLGTLLVASKGLKLLGGLTRGAKSIGRRGSVVGGLAGAGATPVFVVNMGAGGFGGAGGTVSGGGKGGKYRGRGKTLPGGYLTGGFKPSLGQKLARGGRGFLNRIPLPARKLVGGAGRLATPLMVGMSAINLAGVATDKSLSTGQKLDQSTELLGGISGAVAGAKLGATIGTLILPGLGTAIGTGLGGLGGYLVGEFAGDKLGDLFDREPAEKQELSGTIRIQVDGPGRVTDMRSGSPGVDLEAEHNLGPAMAVPG